MGVVSDIYKGFAIGQEGTPGRLLSKYYGVYITGEGVYDMPERDVELITIPGRNGALIMDNGRFNNIQVTYHCGMFGDDQTEFASNIASFRQALSYRTDNGYDYLYDDYNTDTFRKAAYLGGLEVSPVAYGQAGEFDITFECKPQRFFKAGEVERTWSSSGQGITNLSSWRAAPLVKFKMTGTSGTINFGQGGEAGTITINNAPLNTQITVDCEVGEAYTGPSYNPVSANQYVDLGATIPYLEGGGTTNIYYTSNITELKITPRWWTI